MYFRIAYWLVLSFLVPVVAVGQTPPASSLTQASAPYGGLREEVRRADAIVRFDVRSVTLKRAPEGWKSTDPLTSEMTAECVGTVRTVYKGAAIKSGEEIKVTVPALALDTYYREALAKSGRQFFDGSIPTVGDDRIFFLKVSPSRFEVFNSTRVFFDWVIDSDSLLRRYTELSWSEAGETAAALVKLLVKILLSDPARGDPYGVRTVILDDWQRYRRALVPDAAMVRLVSLVVPDMVTTARYAAEGAPLPIVIALAPLLPEDARREIVGALLRLNAALDAPPSTDELKERRRRTLRATIPPMLEMVMYPTRDAATETEPGAVLAAARAFAADAVTHADPAWDDWIAQLAEKTRQADKSRAEQADVPSMTIAASDVIVAERSSEKVGTEYHLVLFKVHRWIKRSASDKTLPGAGFVYVRITPETKRLLPRIKTPEGRPAQVMVFLNAVPEEMSRRWPFRGQQLSTIDPRRFEISNPDNGIVSVNETATSR